MICFATALKTAQMAAAGRCLSDYLRNEAFENRDQRCDDLNMSYKSPSIPFTAGQRLALSAGVALLGLAYYVYWPYFGAPGYPKDWAAPSLLVGNKGGCPDLSGAYDVSDADVWAVFIGNHMEFALPHRVLLTQSDDGNELNISLVPNAQTLTQVRAGAQWPHDSDSFVLKRGPHYYCSGRWLRLKRGDGAAVSRNRAGNVIIGADRVHTGTVKIGVFESDPSSSVLTGWRQLRKRSANDEASLASAYGLEAARVGEVDHGVVQMRIGNYLNVDLCLRIWESANTQPNEPSANAAMSGGLAADQSDCPSPWQRLRYPSALSVDLMIDRPYRVAWRDVHAADSAAETVTVAHATELPLRATPLSGL
jgi:hypothetical protein